MTQTHSLDLLITCHNEVIHDISLDMYGKRLATCSSDKFVKV